MITRLVHFAQPGPPPPKGDRSRDERICNIEREVTLTAAKPWPAEFKRGYRFRSAYHSMADTVPHGGFQVAKGTIVHRSRDGCRITVAEL